MATISTENYGFTQGALCPPPLSIQKKSRRATFHRRILRKSTRSQNSDQYLLGPLDDLIDEIKSDIWHTPPEYSFDSSLLDWMNPYTAPSSMWAVTPLPVSRIPSKQPLTIRKNRHSHSSASVSSFGDAMADSRHDSQEEPVYGGPVGSPYTEQKILWPVLDSAMPVETASAPCSLEIDARNHYPTAHHTLQNVVRNTEGYSGATKRRPSILRLLTNGIPRLRRVGTADTSSSAREGSNTLSLSDDVSLTAHADLENELDANEPSDDAVEAYIRSNARKYVLIFLLYPQGPMPGSSSGKV